MSYLIIYGRPPILTGTEVTNYKFTDQELDSETGLYNYDARFYDPEIGRFICPDPYMSPNLATDIASNKAFANNNLLSYPYSNPDQELDNLTRIFDNKVKPNNSMTGRFRSSHSHFSSTHGANINYAKSTTNNGFSSYFRNPQNLNRYSYCINNPIVFVDPDGLWTFQIGWSFSGGTGAGGTYGKGWIFGKNKEGFHRGSYETAGGGGYGGFGASVVVDITVSWNKDIKQIEGESGSTGGAISVGPITAGGEVNINQGGKPSFTFSSGFAIPNPVFVEGHGYWTKTTIDKSKEERP